MSYMTIWRRVAGWISKATRPQTHASARALTPTLTHSLMCPPSPHSHTDKYVILLLHGNNGFANAAQYSVIRTLSCWVIRPLRRRHLPHTASYRAGISHSAPWTTEDLPLARRDFLQGLRFVSTPQNAEGLWGPPRLRPLDCWHCGFESRWVHECLSVVFVVCRASTGLCDWSLTRPGESYRVCVPQCVIKCNRNHLDTYKGMSR